MYLAEVTTLATSLGIAVAYKQVKQIMASGSAPTATAANCVLGNLQEFDPKVDNIISYLERLELYLEANTTEDGKKVSVLLTVIDPTAYGTLHSLLALTKPKGKSFEDLVKALQTHFAPKPLVIGKQFRFYKREQGAGESIADFIAYIRHLSIKCEFWDFF